MNMVKRIRKNKGWSVKQMAEYLGVSHRTVEGYSQGRNIPQTVVNLLKKVKVDYDDK